MTQRVYDLDAMLDPEAHGMEVCNQCAGYGSSLHERGSRCSKCEGYGLIPKPRQFKVEVIADNSGKWCGNALKFDTQDEAEVYATDLYARWTAVREMRVVDVASGEVVWQQPSR